MPCTPPWLQPGHIPYRDSKLTALLKNSLGGSSLTTMVRWEGRPPSVALEWPGSRGVM